MAAQGRWVRSPAHTGVKSPTSGFEGYKHIYSSCVDIANRSTVANASWPLVCSLLLAYGFELSCGSFRSLVHRVSRAIWEDVRKWGAHSKSSRAPYIPHESHGEVSSNEV